MEFRARIAAVSGTASKSIDKPNTLNVKLEPLELAEPDWLFDRLGETVRVVLTQSPPDATPMERAIDDMFAEQQRR